MKRPSHFHWAAGQTGYLITPSVSTLPFEAHPFTIASYDSSKDVDSSHDSTLSKHTETSSADEKGTRTPVSAWDEGARSYWNDLVFLINVRKGYTKRLGKIAAEKGTVKAWIDGPYGPSPDLSLFDTSVVIAGEFVSFNSLLRCLTAKLFHLHRWGGRVVYTSSVHQRARVSRQPCLFSGFPWLI